MVGKKLNNRFFKLHKNLSIYKILKFLKVEESFFYKYNDFSDNITNFEIKKFSSFVNLNKDSLFFLNKDTPSNLDKVNCACLMKPPLEKKYYKKTIIIPSSNPKFDFCNLINEFCSKKEESSHKRNINNSLISNNARIGKNFSIGCFSYIGSNVQIGDNVKIGNNVKLYDNCVIGDDVVIKDGVIIDCTTIGKYVTISHNTVIGKEGFGFLPGSPNGHIYFHIGGVNIGNDVFIGSNCNVDRGHIDDTIIGDSVRIDNQVHIAHNCIVNKNCILAGKSALSGSVSLGENVVLAGDVGIADNLTIGKNSLISAGTKVFKNFPENTKIGGYPARNLFDWHKIQVKLNNMLKKNKD